MSLRFRVTLSLEASAALACLMLAQPAGSDVTPSDLVNDLVLARFQHLRTIKEEG